MPFITSILHMHVGGRVLVAKHTVAAFSSVRKHKYTADANGQVTLTLAIEAQYSSS